MERYYDKSGRLLFLMAVMNVSWLLQSSPEAVARDAKERRRLGFHLRTSTPHNQLYVCIATVAIMSQFCSPGPHVSFCSQLERPSMGMRVSVRGGLSSTCCVKANDIPPPRPLRRLISQILQMRSHSD